MGKLEKVVVLSVLFVIAVILVVSLTVDDPLDKDKVAIVGAPAPKVAAVDKSAPAVPAQIVAAPVAAPATSGAGAAPAPSALLSMNAPAAQTEMPAASEQPAAKATALPAGALLKTIEGLSDSYLPDMKFYTWKAGDSLRSIAERYYGDATKLALLRRHNEGRVDVQAGEKILIPVFDLESPMTANVEQATDAAPATGKAASKSAAPVQPVKAGGPRTHVVKEGESLWKIAKQELGSGARWKEIYESNRDVLATPDALHTGLRLRIP
ncbi:MAG: LysM peptidoglycan-binding domain-containing protein [Planctomycetota bacterium]